MLTKNKAKRAANNILEILRKENEATKLSHAYNALATGLGYKNWNTLASLLIEEPEDKQEYNYSLSWEMRDFIRDRAVQNHRLVNVYNTDIESDIKINNINNIIYNLGFYHNISKYIFIAKNKKEYEKMISKYSGSSETISICTPIERKKRSSVHTTIQYDIDIFTADCLERVVYIIYIHPTDKYFLTMHPQETSDTNFYSFTDKDNPFALQRESLLNYLSNNMDISEYVVFFDYSLHSETKFHNIRFGRLNFIFSDKLLPGIQIDKKIDFERTYQKIPVDSKE